MRTKKPGKDGLLRSIHDVDSSNTTPGQAVDMSQDDDEGTLGADDEGNASALNEGVDAS